MQDNHTLNLVENEAIEKLQELVREIDMCMFCTQGNGTALVETRPMSTQAVEDDGTIWFFSQKDSHINQQISAQTQVQLLYADISHFHFLTVTGSAEILHDVAKTKELWNKHVEAWFPEGPEAPNITLLKVTPSDAYYWDTKHGKMVALLKIAAAVVTGKTMDDSVEGKLKL